MKLGIFLHLIREVLLIIIILSDRSLGYTSKPRYGSYCAKKGQVHTSCRPTCLPSNNRQNSQKIPSFECRSFNFSSHTPTMNWLRQAVVQIAYSQPTTKRTILRLRIMALLAQSYFTKQPRKAKLAASDIWQPPREIPFQVKVAKSVSLIGHVDLLVRFETSPDSKHWARTVITQRAISHSPLLCYCFDLNLYCYFLGTPCLRKS